MFLKQSTAYTFRMGPFVDDTDGKTAETGLTIEDSHIRVSKAGANFIDKNETTNAAHDEAGFYVVILDTTDTNTVGELQIAIHISGALPVFKTFQVVEEDIYAAFFAGSATLVTKIDAIDTVVDAILVDTGTTLDGKIDTIDGIVDAILVDTGTTLDGKIDVIDGIVDSILVDTGTTLDGKINTIDGIVDAILVDTAEIGAAGAGLTALWTTDIVEAYAGPTETACTPAQLLYMIFSCVGSFTISSDKIITYDLPGSGSMAQAMRFDMDSTSSPTYRKRDA
jgi:hypothetical protein